MTRKPKMNARLEWRGRKLMCNGVEVASIWTNSDRHFCGNSGGNWVGRWVKAERTARRAVNRKFHLPPDFGGTVLHQPQAVK